MCRFFLDLLLSPNVAQLFGHFVPFKSLDLFFASDLGQIVFDHFLASRDVPFSALQAHAFDLFHLEVQRVLHVLVLLDNLSFLLNTSLRRLNRPDRARVWHGIHFSDGLFILTSLVHLLLPNAALSFLHFSLRSRISFFLFIELLDLVVEFITLFDQVVDSFGHFSLNHLPLLFELLLPDRVLPEELECVDGGLSDPRTQIGCPQMGCLHCF